MSPVFSVKSIVIISKDIISNVVVSVIIVNSYLFYFFSILKNKRLSKMEGKATKVQAGPRPSKRGFHVFWSKNIWPTDNWSTHPPHEKRLLQYRANFVSVK